MDGGIYTSELKELIKQIEELRSRIIKAKEGRSYTDSEVIDASQELDAVLDKYQEMMIKNTVDTDQKQKKTSIFPGGSNGLKLILVKCRPPGVILPRRPLLVCTSLVTLTIKRLGLTRRF